ncbi:MAG: hypothetical protein B6D63_07390 [Candidatus Latescibacteria bacterium 4484_7]|nr:MAG: hypothetical protein B6D63_07390 [Candidatus Latescibacteria bacterium 4484_7]
MKRGKIGNDKSLETMVNEHRDTELVESKDSGEKSCSDPLILERRTDLNEILFGSRVLHSEKVLVIGGGGYLGSTLTAKLLSKGYMVSVYDRFIYGKNSLKEIEGNEALRVFEGDIRDLELLEAVMKGHDIVVNLAAIVGDEACMVDPDTTWEINTESIGRIAAMAKRHHVKKMIQASTCSNYGQNGSDIVNEEAPLRPLSLYAKSKVEGEKILLSELSDGPGPKPIVLRFSTLFGYSRRPRFDLVVNTMAAHAWKYGKIKVRGGSQWRPLLHVSDAAEAIISAIEKENGGKKIFNVGANHLNKTILELGKTIQSVIPGIDMEIVQEAVDKRNYRVDFSRIKETFEFEPEYSIETGVLEIIFALDSSGMMDPENEIYSNFKWLSGNSEMIFQRNTQVTT